MRAYKNLNFLSFKKHSREKGVFFLIAGPCVIESEKMCLDHAAAIKEICKALQIPFIFKASYDKANRTSIKSFRGLGINKGLEVLEKVKKKLKILITSDVHEVDQVKSASKVLDIIQIPALLCRQTDLLVAAAKTGKIINVKWKLIEGEEDKFLKSVD